MKTNKCIKQHTVLGNSKEKQDAMKEVADWGMQV